MISFPALSSFPGWVCPREITLKITINNFILIKHIKEIMVSLVVMVNQKGGMMHDRYPLSDGALGPS